MKKLLSKFGSAQALVEFDTEFGTGKCVPFEITIPLETGVAHSNGPGEWFAFYDDDNFLVFQAGKRVWRFDGHLQATYLRLGSIGLFIIRRGWRVEFMKTVKSGATFDPTTDFIDEANSDFFRLLAFRIERLGHVRHGVSS
jgi:hypothetical protein